MSTWRSEERRRLVGSDNLPIAAIVDYGMGNLFSVKHACEQVGLRGVITYDSGQIRNADAVILPGVGAFGDAMEQLKRLDLVDTLRSAALTPKPFVGICLGMQLLMSESFEFGRHEGLGIVRGAVERLEPGEGKVPHVGWNTLIPAQGKEWSHSLLGGIGEGAFMYFVHSFIVKPANPEVVIATTRYGNTEFCSVLRRGNVIAFQCHPEKSGFIGLKVFQNLASLVKTGALQEGSTYVQR